VQLLVNLVVNVYQVDAFGSDDEVLAGCYELLVCDIDPCRLEFI
jgi:hypothetical protein